MPEGVIYGLKAVGGRILYVGRTTQRPLTRLSRHIYHATHFTADSPISNWLRSVDDEQILVVVLQEAPVEQLDERERHWIDELGTLVQHGGLNTRRGLEWSGGRPSATWIARQTPVANHRRWHVNRGIVSPTCDLCSP